MHFDVFYPASMPVSDPEARRRKLSVHNRLGIISSYHVYHGLLLRDAKEKH